MSRLLRCAVYTRKSTEEGLDQAFNSLDAQREACAAYIKSQAGEGWRLVDRTYDDGGFSGGSMERPALTRLLAEIDQGLVDVVVVYKIDRLTRSLADFAKIVERFDKRNVSFVSVTQAFNTTTSMGRLTLNVLLSFAQFEREVTAERIRDKVAASRAKGIFMGGCPPLGYDARERKLVINEAEAKTVRFIFERYLELGSIGKLREELTTLGITTKAFVSTRGKSIGGGSWYVGPLRHVLRNRVYVGEAIHKGKSYPGEHKQIIDKTLFERVQTKLTGSAKGWQRKRTIESSALLTGLIHDDRGNRMSPQWSVGNGGKKHCYYVSQAILQHRRDQQGSLPRVPALAVDELVLRCVDALQRIKAKAAKTRDQTKADNPLARARVRRAISKIVVSESFVRVQLRQGPLPNALEGSGDRLLPGLIDRLPAHTTAECDADGLVVTIPARLRRVGHVRRVDGWQSDEWRRGASRVDKSLLTAFARAHGWLRAIELGQVGNVDELAARENVGRKELRELLRLAFLAPDIQQAIVEGRQPTRLSVISLSDIGKASSWRVQRGALGFDRGL